MRDDFLGLAGIVELKRKPQKCPNCRHSPVATIKYGYPSEYMLQQVEKGRWAIGGCCEEIGAPQWKCTKCGLEMRSDKRGEEYRAHWEEICRNQ